MSSSLRCFSQYSSCLLLLFVPAGRVVARCGLVSCALRLCVLSPYSHVSHVLHQREWRQGVHLEVHDGVGILGGMLPSKKERLGAYLYVQFKVVESFGNVREPFFMLGYSFYYKETPQENPTQSAHPARFSPDDKFSKHRIICKKRFNLLPTQGPPHNY